MIALSARLQAERDVHGLPPGLEVKVRRQLGAIAAHHAVPLRRLPKANAALSFGAGLALAACVALAVLPLPAERSDALVESHIRALQPGHLMDVPSGDQHTVKPWFDGRVDFAPPVKDLAAARFPLLGGRLDYLAGRSVAVLVYGRDKHVIDLYVWPAARSAPSGVDNRAGYNIQRWSQDGMAFSAVSDLNGRELDEFARLWQQR